MKKYLFLLLLLILFPNLAFGTVNNGLADTYVEVGTGCTNSRYIDNDCDGYGPGNGFTTGADADDDDKDVNTTASVVTKYGNV